jgi:hypothetical protein
MREFIYQKIQHISRPLPLSTETIPLSVSNSTSVSDFDETSTIFDHLCSQSSNGRRRSNLIQSDTPQKMLSEEESIEVDIAEMNESYLIPDLTLRYPPKFSHRDLIFGIDGGFLHNGKQAPAFVRRPKFNNIQVRDQVFLYGHIRNLYL